MSRTLQFLVLCVLLCFATAIHIRDWQKATGDVDVKAWAKDTTYYYFASALGITRVKISDYTRDLTIPLNNNEANVFALCLDTNYGYAIINPSAGAPMTVVQFNLGSATNFTRTASLNLFNVEYAASGAICSFDTNVPPTSLLIGISHLTLPAQIVQVGIAPFSLTRLGAISLQESEVKINTVCTDTATNIAYYGMSSNRVVAINTIGAFVLTRNNLYSGSLSTAITGTAAVTACYYDAGSNNIYWGFSNGYVMKTSKTVIGTAIGGTPQIVANMGVTALYADGTNQLYGTGSTATTGYIFRSDVALGVFSSTALTDDGNSPLPVGRVISTSPSPAFRWQIVHTGTTLVGKLWTYDGTNVRVNASSIALNLALSNVISPVDDGAGSFWVASTSPAAIIKIRTRDFAQLQRCSLNAGDGTPTSLIVDPSTVMVGTSGGHIVRFDMNCGRFAWNPQNVFGNGKACNFLLQDAVTSAGNVYCLSSTGTSVAKVGKSDATMTVTRVPFLNENTPVAAVLEPVSQMIYAVTSGATPTIVKFRLSDFVRVSVPLTLLTETGQLTSASDIAVDGTGSIYVLSGASSYVRIFKYSSGFAIQANATFQDSTFNDLNAYAMTVSGGVIYVTAAQQAATTPSKLIRFNANTLARTDSLLFTMSQSLPRTFTNQTLAPFKPVVLSTPPIAQLIGRDTPAIAFSVALCNDGQFYDETTGTCTCCPAGQWLPRETGTCLTCPQGFFCPTQCTISPTGCPAGSFCPQGSTAATACPSGYTSTFLSANCTICPAGSYCTNATVITACPAGTYQNFTGQTSVSACTACPVGQYSTTVGSSSPVNCIYCPAGQYSTVFGAASSTVCTNCLPGSTSDPTRTFCTPCTPGTANPTPGGLCSSCAAGQYANSFGALKCVACPAGQFNPNTTATYCQACLPGTYQNAVGQPACIDCLAGTFQPNSGAYLCYNCPTGTYQNATKATSCLSCPAGYSPGVGTGAEGQAYCGACPPGTFNNMLVGTNQCFSCPTGTYNANYNSTTCQACPAGFVPGALTTGVQNNGATHCTPCSPGTYKTVAASGDSCLSCPIGWYQPSPAASSCMQCPPGTGNSATGQTTCTLCQPGTFSSGDNIIGGACTPCPAGHVSGFYGANNCTKCPSGFTNDAAKTTCIACQIGQYGRDGLCADCPVGTYQPLTGQTTCLRCPAGTYQNGIKSATCLPCSPGSYSASTGAQTCVNCLEGTYAVGQFQLGFFQVGATQCSLCPAGWTTTSTGQTSCIQCQAGQFSAIPGAPACETCQAGSATPFVQQTSCQLCPPGTTVTSTGQTACSYCNVDTFNEVAGYPICKNCPTGYFTNVTRGNTYCITCNDGEYVLNAGGTQKQCAKCLPGAYLPPGVKAATCFSCPGGTYASGYGNTACTSCPAGTFVAGGGQSSVAACQLCALGSYSSAGSTACRVCPLGSYAFPAGKPGASSCKFCPSGTYSNFNNDGNLGETVCLPCPAGTYSAREGSHNIINTTSNNYNIREPHSTQDSCIPCPVGSFAATAGSAQCIPCPQSTYADVLGSATCKPCPGNTYNTQFGSTHFMNCTGNCPSGYTNYAQNTTGISKSDSCVACPAGTFWVSYSQPCLPCPAGTFNPKTAQTQCFDCANSTSIGSTVCCKPVSNGNSTSIVCSSASFGKLFNPMVLLAALALILAALL